MLFTIVFSKSVGIISKAGPISAYLKDQVMPSSPLIPAVPGHGFYDFEAETPVIDIRKAPASGTAEDFPSFSRFYTSSIGKPRNRNSSTYQERLKEAKETGALSWHSGSRYEIIDAIAVGGMGAILRAKDHNAQRDVAMKVMSRAQSNSPEAKRFIRETRIVAKLEHPNIMPVHDIGTSPLGDQPYFTMPLVQGENLADILYRLSKGNQFYRNKYYLHALLEILIKVCNGVAFAHSRNIIHLDLKPHNILVGDYGEVLVLDWGLAREMSSNRLAGGILSDEESENIRLNRDCDHTHLTEDGTVKGTPGFMAPEQANGDVADVDERSDIFSLGSILYMMLTLRYPIVGEHPSEVLRNTINGNFVPPGKRNYHKAVPKQLEAIVMKAMALEKDARFDSVKSFQADINKYLRGYPTSVERAGFFKHLSLLLRRRKTEVGLIGISGLVVLGLLGVIAFFMVRLDSQVKETLKEKEISNLILQRTLAAKAEVKTSRQLAEKEKVQAEAARVIADLNSYVANIRLSDLSIQHSRYHIASNALKDCPAPLRHWEWGRLKYLTTLDALTVPYPKLITAVCISADNFTVALADTDHGITVRNLITGESTRLARNKESEIISMAMSGPASKLIVGGYDKTVELWDLETQNLDKLYIGLSAPVSALDLSEDGTVIAAGSWNGAILIWDDTEEKQIQPIKAHEGPVDTIKLSYSGRRLVSGGNDSTVKLWDCRNGHQMASMKEHEGPVTSVDIDEKRKLVVSGSQDQTIRIWNWENSHRRQILNPNIGEVKTVSLRDDGQSILAGGANSVAGIWDSQAGSLTRFFKGHAGPIINSAFINGGEKIVTVSSDQTIKVWLVSGDDQHRILKGHGSEVLALAISPNDQFIATGSADQTIKIWSTDTGEMVQTIGGYPGLLNGLCFSHDSEDLITTSNEYVVKIWKLKTGRQRLELTGHKGYISSISASLDNRKIITGSHDRTARIWNAINGLKLLELKGHESQIETVALSANGDTAATAGEDRTVRVWNAETGGLLHLLTEFDDIVTALGISPDGSLLIVGTASGNVDVLDSQSGERVWSLKGHWGAVNSVCISNDNKRLFTGSLDTSVKVWDLNTGLELTTLKAHKGAVHAIAISSDNRRIVTAGADSQVIIWETADWESTDKTDEIKATAEEHAEIY